MKSIYHPLALITIFSLLTIARIASGSETIVASYELTDPIDSGLGISLFNSAGTARGQSFTVEADGNLSSVDVFLSRDALHAIDQIFVSIRASENFSNPILAASSFNSSLVLIGSQSAPIDGGGFINVDFSASGLSFVVGDVYTIWLSTNSGSTVASWLGNAGNPYVSGTAFSGIGTSTLPFSADLAFRVNVASIPSEWTFSCDGFEPPLASGPVTVKKNRVLPFKAILLDENLVSIDDFGIIAPPVVQVVFDNGFDPAVDVTGESLPAGAGAEGNQFAFLGANWHYNLATKNYSASGTYTVTMQSGDDSEYQIDPTCTGTFVIN